MRISIGTPSILDISASVSSRGFLASASCRFCNLYKDECFRMTPLDEWRKDLAELASYQPYARRIYWTGANPFAMSFENLKSRALAVYDYLPECQTMAMFSSIRDIKKKKVKQLRILRSLGINGLSIGVESGDDSTLALANKGYTAKDIIEQCRKLDEAGIEYYFVYMTGLAGKGRGYIKQLVTGMGKKQQNSIRTISWRLSKIR